MKHAFATTSRSTWYLSAFMLLALLLSTLAVSRARAAEDAAPPQISVPGDTMVVTTSPAGATVSFAVSASDDSDPSPVITCSKASGSFFSLGATEVRCTARDASGKEASASFDVIVAHGGDADLKVRILEQTAAPISGQTTTYYVEAVNLGPAATATGITVEFNIPPGMTVASIPSNCSGDTTITCSLSSLPMATPVSLSFNVTIGPSTVGAVRSSASISGSQHDPRARNNQVLHDTQIWPPPSPDPVIWIAMVLC